MGGIDDNGIDTSVHECLYAIERIARHANAGSHPQTSLVVLAGRRVILNLGDVTISDKPQEMSVLVHYGKFLYLILEKYLRSLGKVGIIRGHKLLACHNLGNRELHVLLETEVAVCYDTD